MDKLYPNKIVFNNNNAPALNASNLNAMSKAIADIDERVIKGYAQAITAGQYMDEAKELALQAQMSAQSAKISAASAAGDKSQTAKDVETTVQYLEAAQASAQTATEQAQIATDAAENAAEKASTKAAEEAADNVRVLLQGYVNDAKQSATDAAASAEFASKGIGAYIRVTTSTSRFNGMTVTAVGQYETLSGTFENNECQLTAHYIGTYTVSINDPISDKIYSEEVDITNLGMFFNTVLNEHYARITITTTSEELIGFTSIEVYKDDELIDNVRFRHDSLEYTVYDTGVYKFSIYYDSSEYTAVIDVQELDTEYSGTIDLVKIVTFADGTDEEIAKMLKAHYSGSIDISDYWSIGDTRIIPMSATGAIPNMKSKEHVAQNLLFRIIDFEHDNLETPINGKEKAAITLQSVYALGSNGTVEGEYIRGVSKQASEIANTDTYANSPLREWFNTYFIDALPSIVQNTIKTVIKKSFATNTVSDLSVNTTADKAFLLAYNELWGNYSHSSYSGWTSNYKTGGASATNGVESTIYKFYDDMGTNRKRIIYANNNGNAGTACYCMLRTAGGSRPSGISSSGAWSVDNMAYFYTNGIVPCICM